MCGTARIFLAAFALLTAIPAQAQWEIEDSHTTASLRGIHNVGGGIAWASGNNGTVLRTTDDGKSWQTCPVPLAGTKDTAEKLDFRGIQAFDAQTAIVMSSGPGDQSRLYKTTDGCQTWKLLFTNPDKDGFWDAIQFKNQRQGVLVGDPVKSEKPQTKAFAFPLFSTDDSGANWYRGNLNLPVTDSSESIFAASNSSLLFLQSEVVFATGGSEANLQFLRFNGDHVPVVCTGWCDIFTKSPSHLTQSKSAGGFSIATDKQITFAPIVVVGGDYTLPSEPNGTASSCKHVEKDEEAFPGNYLCKKAQTPPHGYRSAVSYDPDTKTWITVGPNGTDISIDDGRNWRPLTPTPQDAPDADKNWNALSLPFGVGPKGRIGKLRPAAVGPSAATPSAVRPPASPHDTTPSKSK